jgi:predicted DNA-binding transcriptional regulator AlpA
MILTTRETADYTRLSETQIERLRQRGDGPPYIKIGRAVRYRDGDIAIWLERHLKNAHVREDI